MSNPEEGRPDRGPGIIAAAIVRAALILSWGMSRSEPRYQLASAGDAVVRMDTDSGELIACNAKASNRLIEIEELTDDELDQLKKFYARLVDLAQEETDIHRSHSIDEAQKSHKEKHP